MKSEEKWVASKYALSNKGQWVPSAEDEEVFVGSRIITSLLCATYVAYIERYARGNLLDIGCGKAPLYGVYRPRVESITCIDWRNTLHPSPHLDFEVDLNGPLPIERGSMDTIICTDVLEHVWNHASLFTEMDRVLAPGGAILLGIPFIYWVHEAPYDYFRWTRHAIEMACAESDLELVELTALGGGIDAIFDIASKLVARKAQQWAKAVNASHGYMKKVPAVANLNRKTSNLFPLAHVACCRKKP